MGSSRLHFKNLAGYNLGELYVSNYSFLKSAVNIEITAGLYLSGTVNMANTADNYKDIFRDISDKRIKDYIWGYNLGLKYDSLLGPIQLLVSDNNKDSEVRFHFSIGFPF
jgi:NTE family protein